MTIYTIDSITGNVLSRTRHKNAQGPVTAVVAEHWAVYHYWSFDHAGRYELGVVELYKGSVSPPARRRHRLISLPRRRSPCASQL